MFADFCLKLLYLVISGHIGLFPVNYDFLLCVFMVFLCIYVYVCVCCVSVCLSFFDTLFACLLSKESNKEKVGSWMGIKVGKIKAGVRGRETMIRIYDMEGQ